MKTTFVSFPVDSAIEEYFGSPSRSGVQRESILELLITYVST